MEPEPICVNPKHGESPQQTAAVTMTIEQSAFFFFFYKPKALSPAKEEPHTWLWYCSVASASLCLVPAKKTQNLPPLKVVTFVNSFSLADHEFTQ
jgi:hypothetical protein